jgi:hypothetical protein
MEWAPTTSAVNSLSFWSKLAFTCEVGAKGMGDSWELKVWVVWDGRGAVGAICSRWCSP